MTCQTQISLRRKLSYNGASSQGSIHESMNLASIWRLPVIFVCENNRYAESTPFEYAVAGGSIANRAAGYGMPGVTVDGTDLAAAYEATAQATLRAARGEGQRGRPPRRRRAR